MKKLQKIAFGMVVLGLLGMASCSNSSQSYDENNEEESTHAVVKVKLLEATWGNAVVAIYDKEYKYAKCTGTLIHPKWVLTSASCVAASDEWSNDSPAPSEEGTFLWNEPKELSVAFGNNLNELKRHQHKIKNIYFHENWGGGEYTMPRNDIALIELASAVPETTAYPITPITPDYNAVSRASLESEPVNVTVVGFGGKKSNGDGGEKLYTEVPLLDYCGALNSDSVEGCISHNKEVAFGTLYYEFAPGGSCNEDEGGPLIIKTEDFPGYAVVGVTSYSIKHDYDGGSGYYGKNCKKFSVDTAVQDFYSSFILKYAPEVDDYHDARITKIETELMDGECGDALKTLCRVMSDDKEITACSITEDASVECTADCEGESCSVCLRAGGIVSSGKCDAEDECGPGEYKNEAGDCVVNDVAMPVDGGCIAYDGSVVENGQNGCIAAEMIATCENGIWKDADFTGRNTNAISTCTNNKREVLCKEGFVVGDDGGCVSATAGAKCAYDEDHEIHHGEWKCYESESVMYQCVDGAFDMEHPIHCECDDWANGCIVADCPKGNGTVYALNTVCISSKEVGTCYDGEWVGRSTCANGCSKGACK